MSQHVHPDEQRRFFYAPWQQLQWAIPILNPRQDTKSCWRCRNSHTRCLGDPTSDDPCGRCAASLGNKDIPCRRGLVCEPLTEIPFVCPLGQGQTYLPRSQDLPADHRDGADLLRNTRSRRDKDCDRARESELQDSPSALLWSVVNTEVPYINTGPPSGFEELALLNSFPLPYDALIVKIVWELQDNPEAAVIMGITSVENLVAFLETASLCESEFGRHDRKKRLVFITMQQLHHCLQALRLSDPRYPRYNLLKPNMHRFCAQANVCICPAFHGVTRYAVRYAEGLTMAFFSKRKGNPNHWLPVIYSLHLQAHVRCVLMTLEERLAIVQDSSFNNMGTPVQQQALRTNNYLYTAIDLFEQITMQGDGKLAKKICDRLAQVQPSVYLRAAYPNVSDTTWQNWHPRNVDDMKDHLHSIFRVGIPLRATVTMPPPQPQYISPHHAAQVSFVPAPGSNMDVTMMTTAFSVMTEPTENAVGNTEVLNAVNMGSYYCDRPQSVSSAYTATSFNPSTADSMSIAESVASDGTVVPDQPYSMDMVMDDNLVFDNHSGFNFSEDFSSGWPSY